MLVRVLGPLEVSGAGGPVAVAGLRQRAVLALLALHAGRPVGLSTLVDALWPDGAPASARNSLQSHVARLRAALAVPGLIALEPAGYRLTLGREAVDALRFEDLLRDGDRPAALRLWRGDPLPEFPGEPFSSIAARLTGLHREAVARHAAETADAGEAVGLLEPLVRADPCWEGGTVVLARALARGGRRGEATEALRRHADAVVDRLGLDPSETVRRVQLALLRGELDPGFAGEPREAPAVVRAGPPAAGVPLRFSSFVGREREQRQLAGLLAEPALVSVVGPGGVGKTRLVAETVRAGTRVAWVDAADVAPADFLDAVAVGVGARIGPMDEPLRVIARAAAEFSVVVLDNCEHVVEPAARVAEAMRGLRVVVTSQERLRADGEAVLELEPLEAGAAARLFRERAGAAPGDGAEVDEIVERLDRLPLAIELAATQATALGVRELRDRLDDRLDLLIRGPRTGSARHRTLRAVVDWSYGLLDEDSRTVLRRLAVFAGAFTVAQAEAVVADDGLRRARVAAVLAGLVDRSLVVRHGAGRFRLLETVRAYVSAPGPDRAATEARHAAVMAAAAEDLDRRTRRPGQAEAIRTIDALLPDLRLAFARGGTDVRVRLAASMYRYGYRCQQYEVLAWGRAAIGAEDHPRAGDALAAAATHAWGRGALDEARALASRVSPPGAPAHEVLGDVAMVACDGATALAHYRAIEGDPVHRVSGLVGEAIVLAWSGRVTEAIAAATLAVEIADEAGNPGARAEARYGLGEALADREPERALEVLDEAAALAQSVDDRLFQGAARTAAVAIRSRHGDPAAALAAFADVLALWRRAGNDTLQAAALRNLVVLLVRVGEDETAVLVDAALPPADLYPAEAARLARARRAAAERLGADRVAAVERRAAILSPARVTDEASRSIDAALSRIGR